jgi:hypothetical protein
MVEPQHNQQTTTTTTTNLRTSSHRSQVQPSQQQQQQHHQSTKQPQFRQKQINNKRTPLSGIDGNVVQRVNNNNNKHQENVVRITKPKVGINTPINTTYINNSITNTEEVSIDNITKEIESDIREIKDGISSIASMAITASESVLNCAVSSMEVWTDRTWSAFMGGL